LESKTKFWIIHGRLLDGLNSMLMGVEWSTEMLIRAIFRLELMEAGSLLSALLTFILPCNVVIQIRCGEDR
jgi:hypothetical protein